MSTNRSDSRSDKHGVRQGQFSGESLMSSAVSWFEAEKVHVTDMVRRHLQSTKCNKMDSECSAFSTTFAKLPIQTATQAKAS